MTPQSNQLVPKRGALRTLSLEIERELTEQDLLTLQTLPGNGPPPLKFLSARHKRQAQMLARGLSPQIVAEALGTTPQRIYQLQRDPAFKELMAIYEDQIHEESIDDEQRFQGRMRAVGETSLDLIGDRLEGIQDDIRISTSELRQLATMAADRTVAPPKVTSPNSNIPQNITLNFGTTLKPPKTINQEGEEENGS
jgi:hypothetical protein